MWEVTAVYDFYPVPGWISAGLLPLQRNVRIYYNRYGIDVIKITYDVAVATDNRQM